MLLDILEPRRVPIHIVFLEICQLILTGIQTCKIYWKWTRPWWVQNAWRRWIWSSSYVPLGPNFTRSNPKIPLEFSEGRLQVPKTYPKHDCGSTKYMSFLPSAMANLASPGALSMPSRELDLKSVRSCERWPRPELLNYTTHTLLLLDIRMK
ncbi:hypothetical protein METBIDRAFT_185877 [Metschnikowia bicuspidata var. bicuspidata NRRL YB-4993]|uniref:Uncharacterized protein n=1 Tax=Metschnikowia bicuspidata var. bicuspidata NRRL YB-4993 TaxID=869754 RepID=A0A1A0HC62_9ASCO|nr:hypothetical protein METBIDRAFT_185877 [Metschnikowia bicuspidata var. bicuspidata NRRL YB-4993]OBA21478.1 hypothetical protein METBIDRAFT_185877 [Metschnikowia bicuspidata var. bicuspidata NRRL YB-4993]